MAGGQARQQARRKASAPSPCLPGWDGNLLLGGGRFNFQVVRGDLDEVFALVAGQVGDSHGHLTSLMPA